MQLLDSKKERRGERKTERVRERRESGTAYQLLRTHEIENICDYTKSSSKALVESFSFS